MLREPLRAGEPPVPRPVGRRAARYDYRTTETVSPRRCRWICCGDQRGGSWCCPCRCPWVVWVGSTCVFVTISLSLIAFFLAESELTLRGKPSVSRGGTSLGSYDACETDADCKSCCDARPGSVPLSSSLNPCVLPPQNSTRVCVDRCCVFPTLPPAPSGTPCDDGLACTANDRCDGRGSCEGTALACVNADFCTAETCSEELGGVCVSAPSSASSLLPVSADACENTCPGGDADCRTGYFCLPSKVCGKTPGQTNGTLFFVGHELEPCLDTADAWSMTQHYVLYESSYVGPQGQRRYRALLSEDNVVFPHAEGYDVHRLSFDDSTQGVPLVSVQSVSSTTIIRPEEDGAPMSKTTLSVNTGCQTLSAEDPTCVSAWADRQYTFEVVYHDCVPGEDDEDVVFRPGELCVPGAWRRPYTMSLSVVDCPLTPTRAQLAPQGFLLVERLGSPGVAVPTTHAGERLRAVVDVDVGHWLDPFLTDAAVCAVDPSHRLAGCATNVQREGCPFRGCRGWSDADTPIVASHVYMTRGEWTAASTLDTVGFCKVKNAYDEPGCAAGGCPWSVRPNRTTLGGADGFEFIVLDPAGTVIVVDVTVRLELCEDELPVADLPNGAQRQISMLRVGGVE